MLYAGLRDFDTRHLDMPCAGMPFYFKVASSSEEFLFVECVIFYEYHSETKSLSVFKSYLLSKRYLLNKYDLLKSWHLFCYRKGCARKVCFHLETVCFQKETYNYLILLYLMLFVSRWKLRVSFWKLLCSFEMPR